MSISLFQGIQNTIKTTHCAKRNYSTSNRGKVFIAGGYRTPFGKFGGSFKDIIPNDLCVIASKATLQSLKVDPKHIDHVVFGNVIPSTPDTIYGARHVALKVGAKIETPAYTVNRLCGSGIQAIVEAKYLIENGEADCVLTAGVENMSMIPHLTYGTRFGSRLESFKVVDFLMESLTDQYCKSPMAITAENLAVKYSITRKEVDEYSYLSNVRAAEAYKNQLMQGEITPVPSRKDVVSVDEHVRFHDTIEELAKLKAVFKKDGVVTAGSASGIVDGATSALVVSEKFVKNHGLSPLAEIGDWSVVGVEPSEMGIGPVFAIKKLLSKCGLTLNDIDLFDINEAFAAQALAVLKELNLSQSIVNVWGGAISIGHPLGATGIRQTHTLARQLKHFNKKVGIASACIGGGQGIALLIKSV
eukprot:TRINITY_DN912_c0_g1_i1.p1 TRINITY_DN912_c0_g1~~TRINITY_DN912_c0_g1_i1.p1  ORF type:complete len:416 (-),score=83.64 TRINITY_DN912_c0_g1_i1:135-1382(-)